MDEQKDKQEKKEPEEKSTEDSGDGDKPKENTLIDDTNLAAKRLEDATAEAKKERLLREEDYTKMKLGGESEAGTTTEKKEETPKEYKDRVMGGKL